MSAFPTSEEPRTISQELLESSKEEIDELAHSAARLERKVRQWENYQATVEDVEELAEDLPKFGAVSLGMALSSIGVGQRGLNSYMDEAPGLWSEDQEENRSAEMAAEFAEERMEEDCDWSGHEAAYLMARQEDIKGALIEYVDELVERYAGEKEEEVSEYVPEDESPVVSPSDMIVGIVRYMKDKEPGETHFDEDLGSEIY